MINIGTIIASAIFIVPSAIASGLHATGPAILVWVVGGVVSRLGAMSVAALGAVTQNVLTLIKIGLLGALIAIAVALPGGSVANFAPIWSDAPFADQIAPLGVALVAVLWAYDGWIEITYVGGEVTDAERNLP